MHKMPFPITPESLERHAAELLDAAARGTQVCPPDGRWRSDVEAQREARDAKACAAWMRAHGQRSVSCIGPFHALDLPKKADRVRVPRGVLVRTHHPSRKDAQAARDQMVKVFALDRGYVDWTNGEPAVVNAKVRWAGEGRYFRWADFNEVEVLG